MTSRLASFPPLGRPAARLTWSCLTPAPQTAAFVAGMGMFAARGGARMTNMLSGPTLKRLQGTFQILVAPTVPLRCVGERAGGWVATLSQAARGACPAAGP
jgi:hypothetical protein